MAYFVPRDGTLTRVTARNQDELRSIRTELELLRRIDRKSRRPGPVPGHAGAAGCALEDRMELARILRDARDPIVREMADLCDREFSGVREEITMTIVNEEAENLVMEASECGVLAADITEAQGTDTTDSEPAESAPGGDIVDALAAAEAALMDALGEGAGDSPTPATSLGASTAGIRAPESANEVAREGCQAGHANNAGNDVGSTEEAADDSGMIAPESDEGAPHEDEQSKPAESATMEGVPDQEADDTQDDQAETEPESPGELQNPMRGEEPASTDPVSPDSEDVGRLTSEYTPERAQQAVEVIEKGLRRISTVLRSEVSNQWTEAKEIISQITATREKITEAQQAADSAVQEICRLRDEARSILEDTKTARCQAMQLRSETENAAEPPIVGVSESENANDETERESPTASNDGDAASTA